MKYCPNCGLKIEYGVECCPRCLASFKNSNKKNVSFITKYKRKRIITTIIITIAIALFLVGCILFYRFVQNLKKEYEKEKNNIDINTARYEFLNTGNNIAYNPQLEEDLRDSLTKENPEIVIDYDLPENANKGIYGVGKGYTKEQVRSILGSPYQDMYDYYCYYYDGKLGAPNLNVVFDENGNVAMLHYYNTIPNYIE